MTINKSYGPSEETSQSIPESLLKGEFCAGARSVHGNFYPRNKQSIISNQMIKWKILPTHFWRNGIF